VQGAPDTLNEANIPSMQLPRCQKCNGLLRPHVVWFGECLERDVVNRTDDALQGCDLLLVVGTSAVVYVSITLLCKICWSSSVVTEACSVDFTLSWWSGKNISFTVVPSCVAYWCWTVWLICVQPAAGYAPMVKAHGGVVAEFNTEDTPISYNCR
jgi:NAD-dependent SIR2 family protein deacetylase